MMCVFESPARGAFTFKMKYALALLLVLIFLVGCISSEEITATVTEEVIGCTASGICTYNYYIDGLLMKEKGQVLWCANAFEPGVMPADQPTMLTCNHDFEPGDTYTLRGVVEGENFSFGK